MTNTDQQITVRDGDAQDFIGMINKTIFRLIEKFQVNEISFIRIKNWFDHKWLNYSGQSVVPFHGGGLVPDSSLNNEWREKITVPPFNPNRVLSETFFRIKPTNNKMFEKPLHATKDSNENIHKRISSYSKNGLFIWYSSDTELNQKGSLMIYRVQDEIVSTFYASFENNNGWKVKQAKNIPVAELLGYITE